MSGKNRPPQIIIISILCLASLVLVYLWYKSANSPSKSPPNPVHSQGRILVIAPHPDDESLGTGGLISEAVSRGDQVKVIFMTNGDGSHNGVQKYIGRLTVRPDDYLYYGRQRQKEAIKAVNKLGIKNRNIIFLGFPDQGLARIWRDYWDPMHPYTSSQTKKSQVPYQMAVAPGETFTAPALANILQKIFKEYRPTAIYVTGTYDCHPDHWAAGAFTLFSVDTLEAGNPSFKPRVYTFDIHRPDRQRAYKDKSMLPPSYFLDNGDKCYVTPLTKEALINKKQALANYKTQIMVMPAFFKSMQRQTHEVFYLNKNKLISQVNYDAETSSDSWPADSLIAYNPATNKKHKSIGVLKAAYLRTDGQDLNIRLVTPKSRADKTAYLVNFYILPATEQTVRRYSLKIIPQNRNYQWLTIPSGFNTPIKIKYQTNKLDIEITNLFLPGEKHLLLNIDSNVNGKIIDRIPWDRLIL